MLNTPCRRAVIGPAGPTGSCLTAVPRVPCMLLLQVSIEMVEAVGHEHLASYFATINAALKPGGKAVIQVREPLFTAGIEGVLVLDRNDAAA